MGQAGPPPLSTTATQLAFCCCYSLLKLCSTVDCKRLIPNQIKVLSQLVLKKDTFNNVLMSSEQCLFVPVISFLSKSFLEKSFGSSKGVFFCAQCFFWRWMRCSVGISGRAIQGPGISQGHHFLLPHIKKCGVIRKGRSRRGKAICLQDGCDFCGGDNDLAGFFLTPVLEAK